MFRFSFIEHASTLTLMLVESESDWNCPLTINLLNFLNEIIQFPFLELTIIIFRDIKMRSWSWSANSIEPGQTARMFRLAWIYTGRKG